MEGLIALHICVYGAASPTIDSSYIAAGEALGRALAESGHTLVFGGGAHGMMGAVANGAKADGGRIIGVVPRFFADETAESLCEFCDETIHTDTMRERKQIMEDRADAFIITPGGIGTFEEFLEILTLRQLCRHEKPIAVFNINGYYDALIEALTKAVQEGFLRPTCMELFCVTQDIPALLTYLQTAPLSSGNVKTYKDG